MVFRSRLRVGYLPLPPPLPWPPRAFACDRGGLCVFFDWPRFELFWLDAPEECSTDFVLAGLEGVGACECCAACFFGFLGFFVLADAVVTACTVVGVGVVTTGHGPGVSP